MSEFNISTNGNDLGKVAINDNFFINLVNQNHKEAVEKEELSSPTVVAPKHQKRLSFKVGAGVLVGVLALVGTISTVQFASEKVSEIKAGCEQKKIEDNKKYYENQISQIKSFLSQGEDFKAYVLAEEIFDSPAFNDDISNYLSQLDIELIENIVLSFRERVVNNDLTLR